MQMPMASLRPRRRRCCSCRNRGQLSGRRRLVALTAVRTPPACMLPVWLRDLLQGLPLMEGSMAAPAHSSRAASPRLQRCLQQEAAAAQPTAQGRPPVRARPALLATQGRSSCARPRLRRGSWPTRRGGCSSGWPPQRRAWPPGMPPCKRRRLSSRQGRGVGAGAQRRRVAPGWVAPSAAGHRQRRPGWCGVGAHTHARCALG